MSDKKDDQSETESVPPSKEPAPQRNPLKPMDTYKGGYRIGGNRGSDIRHIQGEKDD